MKSPQRESKAAVRVPRPLNRELGSEQDRSPGLAIGETIERPAHGIGLLYRPDTDDDENAAPTAEEDAVQDNVLTAEGAMAPLAMFTSRFATPTPGLNVRLKSAVETSLPEP